MAYDLQLVVDLHADGARQGPGGDEETTLALTLAGLPGKSDLKIADIGCGTGASTLVLARELEAQITAVDRFDEFLTRLETAAADVGGITTLAASMDALPFAAASLDAIWSEGAIYNMGFAAGVQAWRRFLKPDGILAVSELTWLTHQRPAALQTFWEDEYPEVDTASAKFAVLERCGFSPVGYFVLPERCWLENYYDPLQARFANFLERHANSPEAQAVVADHTHEIERYERHSSFFGYGFYIARKVGA